MATVQMRAAQDVCRKRKNACALGTSQYQRNTSSLLASPGHPKYFLTQTEK
jgi:hypothetical protein